MPRAQTVVRAAFGWLVDNYPRLADWSAGARRGAARDIGPAPRQFGGSAAEISGASLASV
jgi:hypothetical protein